MSNSNLSTFDVVTFVRGASQIEEFAEMLEAAEENLVIAGFEYMLQAQKTHRSPDAIYQAALEALTRNLPNTESANLLVALGAARVLFAHYLKSTVKKPGLDSVHLYVGVHVNLGIFNGMVKAEPSKIRISWIEKPQNTSIIRDGLDEVFENSGYNFESCYTGDDNCVAYSIPGNNVLSVDEVINLVNEVLGATAYSYEVRLPETIALADGQQFQDRVDEMLMPDEEEIVGQAGY
jgi:hypothetical protein